MHLIELWIKLKKCLPGESLDLSKYYVFNVKGYNLFLPHLHYIKLKINYFLYFSYVNYSTIAARLLRQALKAEPRAEAMKRNDSNIKFTQWIDGKAQSKLQQLTSL